MFHLIDGCKKLGLLKRAMAQEEMFDENRIDAEALEAVKEPKKAAASGKKNGNGGTAKGRKKHPGVTGAELDDNIKSIGEAARSVAETAGETLKH